MAIRDRDHHCPFLFFFSAAFYVDLQVVWRRRGSRSGCNVLTREKTMMSHNDLDLQQHPPPAWLSGIACHSYSSTVMIRSSVQFREWATFLPLHPSCVLCLFPIVVTAVGYIYIFFFVGVFFGKTISLVCLWLRAPVSWLLRSGREIPPVQRWEKDFRLGDLDLTPEVHGSG